MEGGHAFSKKLRQSLDSVDSNSYLILMRLMLATDYCPNTGGVDWQPADHHAAIPLLATGI